MCTARNSHGKPPDIANIGGQRLRQKGSDMTARELEEYSALRATIRNLVPAALARPVAIEWVVVGLPHVLFIAHLWRARRRSAVLRAIDLERFEKLKNQSG